MSKCMIKGQDSIWNRTFSMLFLLTIFDQMAFLCTRAIISKYALNLGFTQTMAGIVAGALSVAALFSRPIAGKLLTGEKNNHKSILMASVIASLAVVGCYMLFRDFLPLTLVRVLNGITYGVSGTVELTMASNSLPEKNMGRGIGVFGLGNIIGLAIAPSISVYLYDHFGADTLFLFCLCSCAVAIVIAGNIPKPVPSAPKETATQITKRKDVSLTGFLKNTFAPEALTPAILNFASQVAYAAISAFIVVYGGEKGWEQIGLFYTVYSVSLFIFRPLNGKLYDKKGLAPLVVFGNLSFAFGMMLIAITDSFFICMLAAVFCAYGYGGAIGTFQADAVKRTVKERRGLASGTYFVFNDLGGFLGATVAGMAASQFGYSRMYLLFMIPLFASIVFYGTMCLKEKNASA